MVCEECMDSVKDEECMDSIRRCTISKADNQIQDLCNQQLGSVSRWNDLQLN